MKPTVVITHWVHGEVIDLLANSCRVVPNNTRETLPREEVIRRAERADALMVFMPDKADEVFLKACPRLKIISGALKGYDNFDVYACTRHNVWFTIVPDLLTVPTAELAMGLLMALARHIPEGDRFIRTGRFQGWRPYLYSVGIAGRTLGIMGFGAVGRAVARRAMAFDMRVIAFDKQESPSWEKENGDISFVTLEQLFAESDFVMPLLPLTPETFHIIGTDAIAKMRPDSIIVNVGRGSLVDEDAVFQALQSGHLAAYGADVFEMEDWARTDRPKQIPQRLLEDVERTCFTPHIGSAVDEVRKEVAMEAARNIIQALQGKRPNGAVNSL